MVNLLLLPSCRYVVQTETKKCDMKMKKWPWKWKFGKIIVKIDLLNAPEYSLRAIRSHHTSLTFISVVFCSCFVCITFILCLFVVVLDCGHFVNLRVAVAQEIQWSSTYQGTDDLIPDNCRRHVDGSLGNIQNPKLLPLMSRWHRIWFSLPSVSECEKWKLHW